MNRSTLVLLVLLLVLGAVTYFLLPSGEERQSSDDARAVRVAIDSASVMRIDIQRPLSLTTIQNVGGVWMVTSPYQYRADPASVTQLVGGLAKFRPGSLVSSNPEKQRLFQVDSTGTLMTVTDRAGAVLQLVFGKMGPSFTEVYFRLPDSKDVYLGEGIDSWMLTREPKEWRDKTILASNTQAVTEINYTVGPATTTFARDSAGWVSGTRRANIESLNPALTALMGLKADDFIDSSVQFRNHPLTVQVKGPEEVTLNLYPLDADSSRYALQSSTTPQLFVVSKYTANQLLKPVEQAGAPGQRAARQVASAPPARKPAPVAAKQTPAPVTKAPVKAPAPAVAEKNRPARSTPQQQKSVPAPAPVVRKSVTEKAAAPVTPTARTTPPARQTQPATTPAKEGAAQAADDEGELTIHTVKKGETMTTIAKKYNVTVDQIIKWNQLKSISVRPGAELYVFVRK